MWLTLYLGGQLKPYKVHRHSEAKEFIIYKSLLRQDDIEAEKIGIDIAINNLSSPNNSEMSVKYNIAEINKRLNTMLNLKSNNITAIHKSKQKEKLAKSLGLTGVSEIDKMNKFYDMLDKAGLIKMKKMTNPE